MYLDNIGFVTTGVGNKLPTPHSANIFGTTPLQWERISNGAPVSPTEVEDEYARVKSDDTKNAILGWAGRGGGSFISKAIDKGIVTIRLTDASFRALFGASLDSFETDVRKIAAFADYDSIPGGFPADAQLGIIGVVWGTGTDPLNPGEWLSKFSQACKERRWGDIAANKLYSWKNIRADRSATLKKVFENAQKIEDQRTTNPGIDVTIVSAPYSGLMLGK